MVKANIKYYGYDFPPHSIIEIIESYNLSPKYTVYILDPFNGIELPYEEITANPSRSLIVISTHEPASHFWFDRLIDKLINSCQVPSTNIVLRSGCLRDLTCQIPRINSIVDEASFFVFRYDKTINSINPTHHFVCLNRLHRWQRFQLVHALLERGLDTFGKISYLDISDLPKNKFQNKFPMSVDLKSVSWEDGHVYDNKLIQGALFNVITETSYEPKLETSEIYYHHLPGITEKSYKCFRMAQIPIWLAAHHSVECYRNLGFDVFDDIINHEYDKIEDPILRIEHVVNEIEKICQLSIESLIDLKNTLMPRFLKNYQTLISYAGNYTVEIPQWTAWLRLTNTSPTVSSWFKQ